MVPQDAPVLFDFSRMGRVLSILSERYGNFESDVITSIPGGCLVRWLRAIGELSVYDYTSGPFVCDEAQYRAWLKNDACADWILTNLCLSHKGRGDEYRHRLQSRRNRRTHAAMPTSFIDYPLGRLDNGMIYSPAPGLLAKAAWANLFRIADEQAGEVREALSSAISDYVGEVVRLLPGVQRVLGENDIRSTLACRKVCDWLVETDDCYLLIEVKSTMSRPEYPRIENYRRFGIVHEMRDALKQIGNTSEGLVESGWGAKPVYGAIVIPEDILGIDDPSVAKRLLGVDGTQSPFMLADLAAPTAVLSLRAFDLFANWMLGVSAAVTSLVRRRWQAHPGRYGGMETFASKLNQRGDIRPGEPFKSWYKDFFVRTDD